MQPGMARDSVNLAEMSRSQLLLYITEVGFVVDDLVLFLDTHEDDKEALKVYNMYCNMYQKAKDIYEEKYCPLTVKAGENDTKWQWVQGPWPWQGGVI